MNLDSLQEALSGEPPTGAELAAALAVMVSGILLALVVSRLIRHFIGRPGGQSEQVAKLIGEVVQWVIILIAAGWALSVFGLDSEWVTLVVAGALILLAFALKPLAEGFAMGVIITSRPAFGLGDEIGVGDHVGEVIEITDRSTVLKLRDGREVHVPNQDVLSEVVTVYTVDDDRRSELEMELALATDLEQARDVITSTLSGVSEVSRVGLVLVRHLGPGVKMSIRIWHDSSIEGENRAIDASLSALISAFDREGIELAPSQEVLVVRPDSGDDSSA